MINLRPSFGSRARGTGLAAGVPNPRADALPRSRNRAITAGITWYAQDALGEVVFFDARDTLGEVDRPGHLVEIERIFDVPGTVRECFGGGRVQRRWPRVMGTARWR